MALTDSEEERKMESVHMQSLMTYPRVCPSLTPSSSPMLFPTRPISPMRLDAAVPATRVREILVGRGSAMA
jgi:hypothetical protein